MANWCENHILIEGPVEKIKQLWENSRSLVDQSNGRLLEAMVPLGEWDYNKSIDNWGTKWDVNTECLEYREEAGVGVIQGSFDSAWSPPIAAVEKYCNENRDCIIDLSYFEPGQGFIGRWTNENGDECWDINLDDPDSLDLDEIPSELREEFSLDLWVQTDEDDEDTSEDADESDDEVDDEEESSTVSTTNEKH